MASGGQTSYISNGYVLIIGLPDFTSVVVTSTSNSFEADNVVAGVPESSTWAMLAFGSRRFWKAPPPPVLRIAS